MTQPKFKIGEVVIILDRSRYNQVVIEQAYFDEGLDKWRYFFGDIVCRYENELIKIN